MTKQDIEKLMDESQRKMNEARNRQDYEYHHGQYDAYYRVWAYWQE